jgi:hypothetical protein
VELQRQLSSFETRNAQEKEKIRSDLQAEVDKLRTQLMFNQHESRPAASPLTQHRQPPAKKICVPHSDGFDMAPRSLQPQNAPETKSVGVVTDLPIITAVPDTPAPKTLLQLMPANVRICRNS